jgi:hypothetical protein
VGANRVSGRHLVMVIALRGGPWPGDLDQRTGEIAGR